MKLLRNLVLIISCILGFAAQAQAPLQPVKWRVSAKTDDDGKGLLTVTAIIADGWHLYGLELPADGPKPTEIKLSGKGVTFTGDIAPVEAATVSKDPLFDAELSWWNKKAVFTAPYTLDSGDSHSVTVTVTYMACNGETCLPPKTETITRNIKSINK